MRYDDRGGLTRAYCTVRLIVVICVTVPDVAVTTMEAGAGFIWLVVLLELPHPVEASGVPAISKGANPPRSSEQRRRPIFGRTTGSLRNREPGVIRPR
jgi:hypothetical protein